MSCLGFKGGIGTSSRVTPAGHTVAVLLLTNFGERKRLTVAGVPIGALLPPADATPPKPAGSCIGVVVTDAPVAGADCARLARRIGLGLARTGSTAHHGSGEIFLGVSTTCRFDRDGRPEDSSRVAGRGLDDLFEAVVDAAEESVLNSLLGASTTVGRDGNLSEGLDPQVVRRLLAEAGRAGH
jgi:D-aminopeptidase